MSSDMLLLPLAIKPAITTSDDTPLMDCSSVSCASQVSVNRTFECGIGLSKKHTPFEWSTRSSFDTHGVATAQLTAKLLPLVSEELYHMVRHSFA